MILMNEKNDKLKRILCIAIILSVPIAIWLSFSGWSHSRVVADTVMRRFVADVFDGDLPSDYVVVVVEHGRVHVRPYGTHLTVRLHNWIANNGYSYSAQAIIRHFSSAWWFGYNNRCLARFYSGVR